MTFNPIHIAASLLPPVPDGLLVRARHLAGTECRQDFTCGGFFKADSPRWRMRQMDLAKASALTIDVDTYDWAGAAEYGPDRQTRKQNMRAATAEHVLDWMKRHQFIQRVHQLAADVGLPDTPNRTIFTGQGLCLVYWLEDDLGWPDKKWSASDMKAVIKRFHEQTDFWWWDSSAKDVGTRIFPIVGGRHRDTGKRVRLLQSRDNVVPLRPWFQKLAKDYPVQMKSKRPRPSAQPRQKGPAAVGSWTQVIWNPILHTSLAMGERAPCPSCHGSGYKRLAADHYSCFSCRTQFKIIPTSQVASARPAPNVSTDQNGHAIWPATTPSHLVNTARTGTGKTKLMEREVQLHLTPGATHRRVLAIAPTIALAGSLAQRLGLPHGDASTSIRLAQTSLVTCFAGLESKSWGIRESILKNTYLMMDEVETCLSQLLGMFSDGERARRAYNLLIHITAHAGRVMLADAHAGPVTAQFLKDVKAYCQAKDISPPTWDRWVTAPHVHSFQYVSPAMALKTDGTQKTVRTSDHQHKGLISQKLKEGKRLAIYIPGREAALGMSRQIQKDHPDLSVVCVVGQKGTHEGNDLSQTALTADVLIYNNAMSTGVSFDIKHHYDEIHMLLGRGSITDSIHVEQAVHRVRHPRSHRVFISGNISTPITDWRTRASGQLDAAIRRYDAGCAIAKRSTGFNLAGDWTCSDESRRLARLQAAILAGRYARGLRWALTYLAQNHDFQPVGGETDDRFSRGAADERDAERMEEAEAIATSQPLSDAQMERCDTVGPATTAEWNQWQAGKLGKMYGAQFEDAGEGKRAQLAMDTRHQKLWPRVKCFALVRCIMAGHYDLAVQSDARSNARQTVMTHQFSLPAARIVNAVLESWKTCRTGNGRIYITEADARRAITAAMPYIREAAMAPRADWNESPFKQIQSLLKLAGLKLRHVQKRVEGQRVREYFMAECDLDEIWNLSSERYFSLMNRALNQSA